MVRHGSGEAGADALYEEPLVLAGDKGMAPSLAAFRAVCYRADGERVGEDYVLAPASLFYTGPRHASLARQVVANKVAELQPSSTCQRCPRAIKPDAEILVMVGSADFLNDDIAGQVNVAVSPDNQAAPSRRFSTLRQLR